MKRFVINFLIFFVAISFTNICVPADWRFLMGVLATLIAILVSMSEE